MRKNISVSILLSILLYIVFLLTCILPFFSKFYLKVLNPIFWTVLFIYTYIKYKDVKIKDKYNNYYAKVSFYISLISVIVFFLMGFIFGFRTLSFSHSFIDICKNIYLFGIVIIFEEYIRYYLINGSLKGTSIPILSTLLFILLDLILYYFLYNYTILKHILFSIIPIIVRNILCLSLANKKSLYSCYLIRLFPILILLLIPVIPKMNALLITLFELFYYIVIYIYLKRVTKKLRSIEIKIKVNKYKKVKMLLLTIVTIVVFFIIGLFKYVPISVYKDDMNSKLSFGDLVIYEKIDDISNLKKDNIIVFLRDSKLVIHYIDDIKLVDGNKIITTRSDYFFDKEDVEEKDIIGVYKYKIAYLGYPSAYIRKIIDKEG